MALSSRRSDPVGRCSGGGRGSVGPRRDGGARTTARRSRCSRSEIRAETRTPVVHRRRARRPSDPAVENPLAEGDLAYVRRGVPGDDEEHPGDRPGTGCRQHPRGGSAERGGAFRINAQLIDAASEGHLWGGAVRGRAVGRQHLPGAERDRGRDHRGAAGAADRIRAGRHRPDAHRGLRRLPGLPAGPDVFPRELPRIELSVGRCDPLARARARSGVRRGMGAQGSRGKHAVPLLLRPVGLARGGIPRVDRALPGAGARPARGTRGAGALVLPHAAGLPPGAARTGDRHRGPPSDAGFETTIASVYRRAGDMEKALEHFEIGVDLDPRSAMAPYSVGETLVLLRGTTRPGGGCAGRWRSVPISHSVSVHEHGELCGPRATRPERACGCSG